MNAISYSQPEAAPRPPEPLAPIPADPLREAHRCLQTAGEALRQPAPGHIDEALVLLRAATRHLIQATGAAG